jgi:hypothetical protein
MNNKYSINCFGSNENIIGFASELKKIGYLKNSIDRGGVNLLAINEYSGSWITSFWNESEWDKFRSNRNYSFEIDNEKEFKAAIAIACMQDSSKENKHEWVVLEGRHTHGDDGYYTIGNLYQLGGRYFKGDGFYTISDDRGLENGHNLYKFRKAIPEEILKHFKIKTKDMNKFEVDKAFIIEAHAVACDSWKRKIELKFPDLFDKKKQALEAIEKVGNVIHYDQRITVKEKLYDNNMTPMIRVPLPTANKEWSLEAFEYVSKFVKAYPNSYPLHDDKVNNVKELIIAFYP